MVGDDCYSYELSHRLKRFNNPPQAVVEVSFLFLWVEPALSTVLLSCGAHRRLLSGLWVLITFKDVLSIAITY